MGREGGVKRCDTHLEIKLRCKNVELFVIKLFLAGKFSNLSANKGLPS